MRELFGWRGTSITNAPCLDIDNSVCNSYSAVFWHIRMIWKIALTYLQKETPDALKASGVVTGF